MLERWKAALEKNGLPCTSETRVLECWIGGEYFLVSLDGSPSRWPNFREAVKNHVFGKNSWFQPKFLLDGTFELMKYHGHVDDPGGLGIKTLGFGTDQNEALLVALEGRL